MFLFNFQLLQNRLFLKRKQFVVAPYQIIVMNSDEENAISTWVCTL